MKKNYWIISDTHFSHKKMKEYCYRPDNFEEITKKSLLNLVKENDVLIHLGDVCIGNDIDNNNFFKQLKSYNILVLGNHDSKSINWYMKNGWDFVCSRFDIKKFGKKIAFTHRPIITMDCYNDINIHGHLHNGIHRKDEFILKDYNKLFSLEKNNYKPILLEDLLK